MSYNNDPASTVAEKSAAPFILLLTESAP